MHCFFQTHGIGTVEETLETVIIIIIMVSQKKTSIKADDYLSELTKLQNMENR